MPDEADKALVFEELRRSIAQSIRKPAPRACGACFNCGEECPGCFCCHGCAEDYEARDAAKERNGL